MLDATPKRSNDWTYLRILGLGARVLVGYILAVAAGALVFAIVGELVLPGIDSPITSSFTEWLRRTTDNAMTFFMLGMVFGIPYTLLGVAVWYFLLPRTRATFLALGAFCPAAAIMTLGITLGGTLWVGPGMLHMTVATIPSGLVAAYIFGAIAMGHGFGRWRRG